MRAEKAHMRVSRLAAASANAENQVLEEARRIGSRGEKRGGEGGCRR